MKGHGLILDSVRRGFGLSITILVLLHCPGPFHRVLLLLLVSTRNGNVPTDTEKIVDTFVER